MQDQEFAEGLTKGEMLLALEWGSCDNCSRHYYCAVCGSRKRDPHKDGCPVPAAIEYLRAAL